METLRQDIQYAFRSIRRAPAFFAAAVAIIALGIGANTAIFSVVHGILFRPVNFHAADRLVWIENTGGDGGRSSRTTRVFNYRDWKSMSQSFEDMTAYFAYFDYGPSVMTGHGEPERFGSVPVARNFLDFLGVKMLLGRNFTEDEAMDFSRRPVILSHGFWQRRFAGARGVIGQPLIVNDKPATVVGVLPPSFDFQGVFSPGTRIDVLTPFPMNADTETWGNTLSVMARLRPGVSIAQAQQELDRLNRGIAEANRDRPPFGGRISRLSDYLTARFRRGLLVLSAAVGLVLLIACTNLSNLLLARAASRRKEVTIRAALGASRGRLIRQLLTESLIVALTGAALGLGLAYAAVHALAAAREFSIPLLATVSLDPMALAFTALAAIGAGVVMGVAPAWHASSANAAEAMNDASRGSSAGRRGGWVRSSLVVTQIALACLLLVGAGLLMRSFQRVLDVDLGFRPQQAGVWRVDAGTRYPRIADRRSFFHRVAGRVEQIPGVEAAGLTDALPLSRDRSWNMIPRGAQFARGTAPVVHPRLVDWRYLKAMEIRLIEGRELNEADNADKERVLIVNQKAARQLFPGESALGKKVHFSGERTIVGVAANVRHQALEEEGGMEAYLPVAQYYTDSMEMVVRTRMDLAAIAPAVRRALREVDPALVGGEYEPLAALVERAVSPRRFLMLLLAGFALSALLLASIGIYAVVSYSVSQRRQEIGIRMALGAQASAVGRMVLARTALLAGIGIAIGVAGALAFGQLASSLLFGVKAADFVTFAGTIGVLASVALVAGLWPALRAARVNPVTALRGGSS